MTQKSGCREQREHVIAEKSAAGAQPSGPMRTLKRGDRITVHGDLEIVDMDGRRVEVRLHPSSSPIMFPVKAQLNAPRR